MKAQIIQKVWFVPNGESTDGNSADISEFFLRWHVQVVMFTFYKQKDASMDAVFAHKFFGKAIHHWKNACTQQFNSSKSATPDNLNHIWPYCHLFLGASWPHFKTDVMLH